jgi:hypothetical protein
LKIPKRGIRYVDASKAPIAEPIKSTLYKLAAACGNDSLRNREASANSTPIRTATIKVRTKNKEWIKTGYME